MNFYIQASNPAYIKNFDMNDVTLADAIETSFPLETESAVLVWNYIPILISYKYDISYMMEDLIKLLNLLLSEECYCYTIEWLPDTFRCNWELSWKKGEVTIITACESTVGYLEPLLNKNNIIELSITDFICEWKLIIEKVVHVLQQNGYHRNNLSRMDELIELHEKIKSYGVLYR